MDSLLFIIDHSFCTFPTAESTYTYYENETNHTLSCLGSYGSKIIEVVAASARAIICLSTV